MVACTVSASHICAASCCFLREFLVLENCENMPSTSRWYALSSEIASVGLFWDRVEDDLRLLDMRFTLSNAWYKSVVAHDGAASVGPAIGGGLQALSEDGIRA